MLILGDVYWDARVARAASAAAERASVTVLGVARPEQVCALPSFVRAARCTVRLVRLRSTLWPLGRWRRVAGYIEGAVRVAWLAWRAKPDMIHAHEVKALPIAILLRVLAGVPFVYDAHELYRESGSSGWLRRRAVALLEYVGFGLAHAVIACSDDRAEVMRMEYGCHRSPQVVRNVWDPETYLPVPHEQGSEEPGESLRRKMFRHNPRIRRVALYQGWLSAERDLLTVVSAMARMPDDCGLVLIGPSAPGFRDRLRRDVASHGIERRVLILDAVHPMRLAALTRDADVGIVSYGSASRNNVMCAPNKLSEYTVAGIPVIGTDQRSVREFVVEHGNGTTYSPGDVQGCAEALRLAMVHRPTADSLCERAKAASSRISWEPERRKLDALYERILRRAS